MPLRKPYRIRGLGRYDSRLTDIFLSRRTVPRSRQSLPPAKDFMSDHSAPANGGLLETGVAGLDSILGGGLTPHRLYLVEGDPGSGKTTLSLQFLLTGVARGESCMFVTLSESEEELRASAHSHGWSLDGINIVEIIASEESLK